MAFLRRLFSRSAPKHDRRPGVYVTRSVMTGAWNAPAPSRMDQMEKEAARMGREDGEGGQHSSWTHAPKPAALRRFEALRQENIAALQAERVGAVGMARADAEVGHHGIAVDLGPLGIPAILFRKLGDPALPREAYAGSIRMCSEQQKNEQLVPG